MLCNLSRHLDICLQNLVRQLWMINEHLLLSHLLNSLVSVALHGVVVLVNLNAKSAACGEVVRLGKMSQTVMLHRLKVENILQWWYQNYFKHH